MEAIKSYAQIVMALLIMSLTGMPFAHATTSPQQLAYFVGHETIQYGHGHPPSGIYYKTKAYRVVGTPYPRVIWTRWKDVGYGCRSQCLIDRFSGQVVTCRRACVW